MNILWFELSQHRFLRQALVGFFLVSAFAGSEGVSAQKQTGAGKLSPQGETTVTRNGDTIEIQTYSKIPEATEPCTSEELEWWNRLRKAQDDLLVAHKKGNAKAIAGAKEKFFVLLLEAPQKSYRVPLKDRPPLMLGLARQPILPDIARKNQIAGTVVLSVEFRSDGSVGDIQIIKGRGFGITESVVHAVRDNIFLPAIENGGFVAHRSEVKTEFANKWTQNVKGNKN
jgi:TonB family protein